MVQVVLCCELVVVYMNRTPILTINEVENNARVQKMRLKLQGYDFTIRFVLGQINVVAFVWQRLQSFSSKENEIKINSNKYLYDLIDEKYWFTNVIIFCLCLKQSQMLQSFNKLKHSIYLKILQNSCHQYNCIFNNWWRAQSTRIFEVLCKSHEILTSAAEDHHHHPRVCYLFKLYRVIIST